MKKTNVSASNSSRQQAPKGKINTTTATAKKNDSLKKEPKSSKK